MYDVGMGIILPLTSLVTNSYYTVTTGSLATLSANLSADSTALTVVTAFPASIAFDPFTPGDGTIVTGIFISTSGNVFLTFSIKEVEIEFGSMTNPVLIDGPCTANTLSTFNYTLTDSLPSWISYTQDNTTSTQSFTLTPVLATFGSLFMIEFNSSLQNV